MTIELNKINLKDLSLEKLSSLMGRFDSITNAAVFKEYTIRIHGDVFYSFMINLLKNADSPIGKALDLNVEPYRAVFKKFLINEIDITSDNLPDEIMIEE